MKKYLKYLGFGFLTLLFYYSINLSMVFVTDLFYSSEFDKIYGTFGEPRNPLYIIRIFIIICFLYIIILLVSFLFGRLFEFSNEKMLLAFVLFIIPNITIQMLVYYFNSVELMCMLNWFMKSFSDVFFFETQKAYDVSYSYFWNSLLTYFPFIFAFFGGLAKRKKRKTNGELLSD